MKIKVFAGISIVGLLASLALMIWIVSSVKQPLQVSSGTRIEVKAGMGFSHVVYQLSTQGAVGQLLPVKIYYRLAGAPELHVGTYAIDQDETLASLSQKMQRGDVLTTDFQIIEGWNVWMLLSELAEASDIVTTEPALTPDNIADRLQLDKTWAEGLFLPETYQVPVGTTDIELLKIAHDALNQKLQTFWSEKQDHLFYQSPYEVLIMASIIERETGVAEERPMISGVFTRRVELGMKLQTDPTIIYGLMRQGQYKGRILKRHLLDRSNPYSTYAIHGLPPTPIALPSEAAIEAALNPADTKAVFFVAKGDGTHKFSETLAEHNRAVRQYQLNRKSDYRSAPK